MTTDWDINEGLDPEGPSGADLDRFGDELTPCRHCGKHIYDQSEICPHCGGYITEPDHHVSFWVLIGVFMLIAVLLFVVW
jgi:hypothetical protein